MIETQENTKTATKIVCIVKVEDTRQYEEIGDDVWVPIPGSGSENQCFRCNRIHEVHAHVELENGSSVIVGTGCMHADDAVAATTVKSAASRAKTIAKLNAKLAALKSKQQAWDNAEKTVDAMPLPEIVESKYTDSQIQLKCGDGWCIGRERNSEREDCVKWSWRHNRIKEICGMSSRPHTRDLEKRLTRLLSK